MVRLDKVEVDQVVDIVKVVEVDTMEEALVVQFPIWFFLVLEVLPSFLVILVAML